MREPCISTPQEHGCNYKLHAYAVPKAAPDQTLVEKTPQIVDGNYETVKKRAECIKHIMPNVKILFHLCDPTKRFVSHANHRFSAKLPSLDRDELLVKRVQNAVFELSNQNEASLNAPSASDFSKSLSNNQTESLVWLSKGHKSSDHSWPIFL